MLRTIVLSALLLFCMASCTTNGTESMAVRGYVPVYLQTTDVKTTSVGAPRATVHAGKIYSFRDLLFQVEQGQGIHIIDNTFPSQAKKIAFLSVPACSELAVKSGFLYTNNLEDMLVFDLSTPASPKLVKRLEHAFPGVNQTYPPYSNVYFECVDPSKGVVVDWKEALIENPSCRR